MFSNVTDNRLFVFLRLIYQENNICSDTGLRSYFSRAFFFFFLCRTQSIIDASWRWHTIGEREKKNKTRVQQRYYRRGLWIINRRHRNYTEGGRNVEKFRKNEHHGPRAFKGFTTGKRNDEEIKFYVISKAAFPEHPRPPGENGNRFTSWFYLFYRFLFSTIFNARRQYKLQPHRRCDVRVDCRYHINELSSPKRSASAYRIVLRARHDGWGGEKRLSSERIKTSATKLLFDRRTLLIRHKKTIL